MNNFLKIVGMVLDAKLAQGYVFRNVANMIDKRLGDTRTVPSLTAEQVRHPSG